MHNRPFFSLVVPCYNDGRYKAGYYLDRLLTSVVQSDLDYNDIEVILVDDKSPKSYGRVISKFQTHFNIKHISASNHVGYPGPIRNIGALSAQGEWMCFADHDDMFYPRALHTVKDIIETSKGGPIFVHADFDKVCEDSLGEVIECFKGEDNNSMMFVHGKFYNNDKLWKAYHLSFPENLSSHEDLALGTQLRCVLRKLPTSSTLHIPTPVYMWINNPDSISNTLYKDTKEHSFLERSYNNYLQAVIGQYIAGYNMDRISNEDLIGQVVPLFLNCWFQIHTFKLNHPETYITKNDLYIQSIWNQFKESIKLSSPALKVMMKQMCGAVVRSIDETAAKYNLPDFDTWISQLDGKEQSHE